MLLRLEFSDKTGLIFGRSMLTMLLLLRQLYSCEIGFFIRCVVIKSECRLGSNIQLAGHEPRLGHSVSDLDGFDVKYPLKPRTPKSCIKSSNNRYEPEIGADSPKSYTRIIKKDNLISKP